MNKELRTYIIEQCRRWMLPEDKKALRRLSLTTYGNISTINISSENLKLEFFYGYKDEKTNELVALGLEQLEITIVNRILKEHEKEVINICPKCGGLARTPFAKQCRHCGHDWH